MIPKKKLPLDISTFDMLISDGYLYVDKTKLIHQIITSGRLFFFARPRRFGKSLLISTLKQLFLGNKSLFKETWIGQEGLYDWQEHPVIHIDFSGLDWSSIANLDKTLKEHLEKVAENYGISLEKSATATSKFATLVEELAVKARVVILIDEYDAPIVKNLDAAHDLKLARAMRDYLSNFYTTIKSVEGHLRFFFLTGVSKFSKTSVFSGLNNLNDLSLDAEYATLCGYTQQEVQSTLAPYIDEVAKFKKCTTQDIMNEIRAWYNGYRFSAAPERVYNPFSLFYYLAKKERENYWFATGTPSFLVALVEKNLEIFEIIDHLEVSSATLNAFDLDTIPLSTLLLQTGYLTIESYNEADRRYRLTYPNMEVKLSFSENLMASFLQANPDTINSIQPKLQRALRERNIAEFCLILQTIFARIPHNLHLQKEAYYHSLLQVIGSVLGLDCQSEVSGSTGRLDLILKTTTTIYIFELKLDKSAEEALKQIREKRYYEPYLAENKTIELIGLSFMFKNKELDFKCEVL